MICQIVKTVKLYSDNQLYKASQARQPGGYRLLIYRWTVCGFDPGTAFIASPDDSALGHLTISSTQKGCSIAFGLSFAPPPTGWILLTAFHKHTYVLMCMNQACWPDNKMLNHNRINKPSAIIYLSNIVFFRRFLIKISNSGLSRFPLGISVFTQWQVKH